MKSTTHASLFTPYLVGVAERTQLARDGHFLFPGLLTPKVCVDLANALEDVQAQSDAASEGESPNRYAAEVNGYLESLIVHPELLELARSVIGPNIRYDHCVSLNRPPGNPGVAWHTHEYSDDNPKLGFVRIFFYVNGFRPGDGALKVVAGSHLFRDPTIRASNDEELTAGWMMGRTHPETGEPLCIEELTAPVGTVALMWTHALHGVTARLPSSVTRWTIVIAYRNPGKPSAARWINPEFEHKQIPGAEGLMSLY